MNKIYKAWLYLKDFLLFVTLLFYVIFLIDVFFGEKNLEQKYIDGIYWERNMPKMYMDEIYSPELKLALILFAVMCTIETVILFIEWKKDEVRSEFFDYFEENIDVSEYLPENISDALKFDYEKEEPRLIKKAVFKNYLKLITASLFFIIGVVLTFMTSSLSYESIDVRMYRAFWIFEIFRILFLVLTTFMILDYSLKILQIKKILKKKRK
jgi:hypothetical protein